MGIFGDLAGVIGAVGGITGAQEANAANKKAAGRQMDFQERSYRHRYQWQMQDMKAAGLNPILSYKTGAGSSLPGASYQAQNVGQAIGPNLIAGENTAISSRRAKADVKQKGAATSQLKAQVGLTNSAASLNMAKAIQTNVATKLGAAQTIYQLRMNSIVRTRKDAEVLRRQVLKTPAGKTALKAGYFGQLVNPFASTAKALIPPIR